MNTRLTLLLLLIVSGLGYWYINQLSTDDHRSDQLIKKEGEAEYTGNQVTTEVYDLNGKPQYFAQANEIKRYQESERTEFFKPLLNLFDQQTALKQWNVTAEQAEINKEKILTLSGNVRIESLDPKSKLQKLETQQLSINLETQDISSNSLVKSQGLGFTSTGKGLTGNLKKQIATLTKDVKTYIEPSVIKADEQPDLAPSKDTTQ